MKTWEVYKMLDEWNENTTSPLLLNKANNLIYVFVSDGERKGLRLAEEKRNGKTQYHFSLNGEWEIINHLYSVGEFVVNNLSNKVHKIAERLSHGQYKSEDRTILHENNLRKATEVDIRLLEKWNKIGRKMNEFKKWDIVKDSDGHLGFHYREVLSVNGDYLRCTGGVDTHKSNVKLVTPMERRFDTE